MNFVEQLETRAKAEGLARPAPTSWHSGEGLAVLSPLTSSGAGSPLTQFLTFDAWNRPGLSLVSVDRDWESFYGDR